MKHYALIPGPGDFDPPEDEPYPCFTCEGSGIKATDEDDWAECPDCSGMGWIGVDGEPCCDPRQA
jgi:DnaJ-class molecular chaperone